MLGFYDAHTFFYLSLSTFVFLADAKLFDRSHIIYEIQHNFVVYLLFFRNQIDGIQKKFNGKNIKYVDRTMFDLAFHLYTFSRKHTQDCCAFRRTIKKLAFAFETSEWEREREKNPTDGDARTARKINIKLRFSTELLILLCICLLIAGTGWHRLAPVQRMTTKQEQNIKYFNLQTYS